MGKQKKMCWKCNGKHLPPTGAKCEQSGLSVQAGGSIVAEKGAVSERELDSYVIPSTSKATASSSAQNREEDVQQLILEQLQKVNQCLDKVEGRMDKEQRGAKDRDTGKRLKKLSSISKRQKPIESDSSQSNSESSDEDQDIPSLYSIRQSEKIQRQVDARIRELEQQSQSSDSMFYARFVGWPAFSEILQQKVHTFRGGKFTGSSPVSVHPNFQYKITRQILCTSIAKCHY